MPFNFTTFSDSPDFKPRIAIYGDMGVNNHVALDKLIDGARKSEFDLVIHNGDFAYDMNELMGLRGDIFMNLLQPMTSLLPLSVTVGNHEQYNNFSEYSGRFTTPPPSVFYHSYNLGPIHFVLFSSEFYFYDQYGTGQLQVRPNQNISNLKFLKRFGRFSKLIITSVSFLEATKGQT